MKEDLVEIVDANGRKRWVIPIASGQKFGYWTVLSNDFQSGHVWKWRCKCVCGTIKIVTSVQLLRGNSKSCGCKRRQHNLEGQRFGRWLVGEYVQVGRGGISKYLCKCDCGTEKLVNPRELLKGLSTSCGCSIKLADGQAALNCVLTTYRNTAAKRGIEWNLSPEEFFVLTKMNCYYCNCVPFQVRSYKSTKSVIYMGVDRIDSNLNYTSDNVVPCCKMCNYAKLAWTQDIFFDWISRVFNHSVKGRRKNESDILRP